MTSEISLEDRYCAALIYAVHSRDKDVEQLVGPKTPAMEAHRADVKAAFEFNALRTLIDIELRAIATEEVMIRPKNNNALDEANAKLAKMRTSLDALLTKMDDLCRRHPHSVRAMESRRNNERELQTLEEAQKHSQESLNQFNSRADSLRRELEATTKAIDGFKHGHEVASRELLKRRRLDEEGTKK